MFFSDDVEFESFENAGVKPPIYFYRDSDGKEIDLLIERDDKIYPIEIKATSTPSKKDCKNLKAAKSIKDKEIMEGIVVCNCQKPSPIAENVIAIPYTFV